MKKKNNPPDNVACPFGAKHSADVIGVLSGSNSDILVALLVVGQLGESVNHAG